MNPWLAVLETTPTNVTIGSYHAFFVHFPIILFSLALLCDLLFYFGRERAHAWGNWFVILGVLACMPAMFTGIAAAQGIVHPSELLSKHVYLGYVCAVATSLYAGIRISDMWWNLKIPPSFYVMISIVIVALLSWTADYAWLAHVPMPK